MAAKPEEVDYYDLAMTDIVNDTSNSIQDAIQSDDNLPDRIIQHWIDNEPKKAGELLFTLLDDLLNEIADLRANE